MKHASLKITAALMMAVCMFCGCAEEKKYKLIIEDEFNLFESVNTEYRAGEEVVLQIPDDGSIYELYCDEEMLTGEEQDDVFVWSFAMPEHDVKIRYTKEETASGEKQLLIDCFDRVVGTPEEMPYEELVLYTFNENKLLLEVYSEGGTEAETVRGYLTDHTVYDAVMEVIGSHEMQKWNDEQGMAVTGRYFVCRFMDSDAFYRVTSDNMPEGGPGAFDEVWNKLASFADQDEMIYEKKTYVKEEEEMHVLNRSDIGQYLVLEEINIENCTDYFDLKEVMEEEVDENGNNTGETHNDLVVSMKDGYFPYQDMNVTVDLVMKLNGKEEEKTQDVALTIASAWDADEESLAHTVISLEPDTEISECYISGVSGHVCRFDIPEAYLQEGETGKFFMSDEDIRYYLNGVKEGSDELWFREFTGE